MHSFLRAIGFSQYKNFRQLETIYRQTMHEANRKIITTVSIDTSLIQFEKDFGPTFGLAIIGESDVNGQLSVEHCFPYIKGENYLEFENITIEKQASKESYAGVCDDIRLGMTVIFYLNNIADYAKSKWFNYSNRNLTDIKFSALSIHGTIMLGVKKDKAAIAYEQNERVSRNQLLEAAKESDSEAIESLTLDDMNTYVEISSRIAKEDLFSIVDTSFMPCGVECDHYMVVANILKVSEFENELTHETVYDLLVETNDILMNIGINKLDLQGEPKVGRRFRGEIWLQGTVRI